MHTHTHIYAHTRVYTHTHTHTHTCTYTHTHNSRMSKRAFLFFYSHIYIHTHLIYKSPERRNCILFWMLNTFFHMHAYTNTQFVSFQRERIAGWSWRVSVYFHMWVCIFICDRCRVGVYFHICISIVCNCVFSYVIVVE